MPLIAPNSTSLSGIYFVAAELYRRGSSQSAPNDLVDQAMELKQI